MDVHESNRACWNEWAEDWRSKADERGIWKKCHERPELVLSPREMEFLSDIRGKDVCVLGSGDNEVVFALAGMGAHVTSVDISERQLEIARERAGILRLDIFFVRSDVIDLAELKVGNFDLVYTGGHMSVWVSDIGRYYREAVRILRPKGIFIVNDYHPVRRMWHESTGPKPHNDYLNRGPYKYKSDEGHVQTEFHWTIADHIQAVIDAGCELVQVEEYGVETEKADYAKWIPDSLPLYLMIVGRKRKPPVAAG